MTQKLKDFYTVADLAARWEISARTVHRIIASGSLKTHQIGVKKRVSHDDLVAFERSRRG